MAVTSFWTGQIAKDHRTHTVNSVLKSARFLVTFLRVSWHDTRRVTICLLPYSLVIGEDCLYTSTSEPQTAQDAPWLNGPSLK